MPYHMFKDRITSYSDFLDLEKKEHDKHEKEMRSKMSSSRAKSPKGRR